MATPPTRGKRGSGFGMRVHPIDGTYRMHYGEDGIGSGNYAPVTGAVVFAGYDNTGHGFGWAVGIREAASPKTIWWIAHHGTSPSINPLRVAVGDSVLEGNTYLGPSGTTGAAKGQHAHTERRVSGGTRPGQGTATDPRAYYTNTSGGGENPAPIPNPSIKEEELETMTTVYASKFPASVSQTDIDFLNGLLRSSSLNTGANVGIYALCGDSPGTFANVQITQADALGNSWAADHSGALDIARDTVALGKGARNLDWTHFIATLRGYLTPIGGGAGGGLTPAQNSALMGLPDAVADLPTNGELSQALTSTVLLVNDHADENKDEIIAAIPGIPGSGSYDLSLTIDEIPGTATGTATAQ